MLEQHNERFGQSCSIRVAAGRLSLGSGEKIPSPAANGDPLARTVVRRSMEQLVLVTRIVVLYSFLY